MHPRIRENVIPKEKSALEENKIKIKEAQEFEAVRERARLEKVPFPSNEFPTNMSTTKNNYGS